MVHRIVDPLMPHSLRSPKSFHHVANPVEGPYIARRELYPDVLVMAVRKCALGRDACEESVGHAIASRELERKAGHQSSLAVGFSRGTQDWGSRSIPQEHVTQGV